MSSGIPQATTTRPGATAYCEGHSCEAEIASVLMLIAGRWSVPVLEQLYFANGPVRFRELQRRVGAISQKELTRQLTAFVHRSVAIRRVSGAGDSHVEYELAPRGHALLARLDALGQWAKRPRIDAAASTKLLRVRKEAPANSWLSPLAHVSPDTKET